MSPARPSRTPAQAPSRPRLGRVAALAAGATLAAGALAAPLAAAGPTGTDATGSVALVADTVAPSVTLGSASVKAGGEVGFKVTGFPAGANLAVKFDDKDVLLRDFPIGADGSASGRVTVPASAAPGGEHWLRFLAPQTSVRSENLTVTADTPSPTPTPTPTPAEPTPKPTPTPTAPAAAPKVKLAGSSVTAGGKLTFTLSGFVKGQSVTVKLDDSEIIGQWPGAVKADGTLTASVTVPASAGAGAHWLRFLAPDPSTSLKADFTVTGSGTGGSTGGSGGSTGGSGTGGSTGGSGGSGTGGSTGSTGGSGTGGSESGSGAASATITAGSQVAAGGRVSFRVTGFPAGQQLTVKLDDSKIIGQWTGIGADGSFSGSVTVPADAVKGAHWLRFLAPNPSTSLRADFTVTSGAEAGPDAAAGTSGGTAGGPATPVPAASGAPASASNSRGAKAEVTASQVQAGGKIHFKVSKFPAGQTVTVKFDDEEILGQWKADTTGAYEGEVTVPEETPAGAHWLRFLAPNPSTTLKVDITVSAPGAPAADTGQAAALAVPRLTTDTTATAASAEAPVSYATIAWSAAAAAAGGAAGAAATTLFVVRRRPGGPAAQA
ncbi:hypothetical protein CP967_01535 [Streptomyces nitrosporeus]|uniref:Uncharacterized protein n=1 Tax=Streptomyces nitrosporeus TaxID=28894 RepID=A0A5J6F394_9ACTN|nr:hypothetical protein [Streptomyces nitrosporeus]QEU70808.1 hypothetical protein CP967_01535 [Streptomyces nitrosporeus]GGZ24717.1 hypothetical protein GCM10010327_64430 [Streptomyces nitrosporeus]